MIVMTSAPNIFKTSHFHPLCKIGLEPDLLNFFLTNPLGLFKTSNHQPFFKYQLHQVISKDRPIRALKIFGPLGLFLNINLLKALQNIDPLSHFRISVHLASFERLYKSSHFDNWFIKTLLNIS
jgi:hypothetical protein